MKSDLAAAYNTDCREYLQALVDEYNTDSEEYNEKFEALVACTHARHLNSLKADELGKRLYALCERMEACAMKAKFKIEPGCVQARRPQVDALLGIIEFRLGLPNVEI